MVLRRPSHIDPCAQQIARANGAICDLLQAVFIRLDGSHGGVKAAHHKFRKGLPPREPLFAQHVDALIDERIIGGGGPKAKRAFRLQFLQFRGDGEKLIKRVFGLCQVTIHISDKLRQGFVQLAHPCANIARAGKAEHGHGFIGFDFANTLHHAADTPLACLAIHKNGKAHMPAAINAKIACNHSTSIENRTDGKAFWNEPLVNLLCDLGIAWGIGHANMQRCDPRTGCGF